MLSYLVAGIIWASVAAAQTSTTATFKPLGTGWGNYDSLQQCQMSCVASGPLSGTFDTLDNAKNHCPDLPDLLNQAFSCVTERGGTTCDGSNSAGHTAQAVVAAFCSSVGTAFSLSIPATTVSGFTTTLASTGVAVVTITGTPEASGTSSGAEALPATPSATGSASGVQAIPSSTSSGLAPSTPSSDAASSSSSVALQENAKSGGMSSSEKVGIGIGVGLGVPIIIGIIAALFFMRRRRKGRGAGGPYGPVLTNEKGVRESGSYSSPGMEPHEMHPMGSHAPFLPALATQNIDRRDHENQWEPTPATINSRDQDQQYQDEPPVAMPDEKPQSSQREQAFGAQERPATSRDVSPAGTPPLDSPARPQTAPHHLAPVEDDEPPSPISPVSPISPAGSRPASLEHARDHHDL